MNATTHGLTSDMIVLHLFEKGEDFEILREEHRNLYKPENEVEEACLLRITIATLKLKRAEIFEANLLNKEITDIETMGEDFCEVLEKKLDRMSIYWNRVTRSLHRDEIALEQMKKQRPGPPPVAPPQQSPAYTSQIPQPSATPTIDPMAWIQAQNKLTENDYLHIATDDYMGVARMVTFYRCFEKVLSRNLKGLEALPNMQIEAKKEYARLITENGKKAYALILKSITKDQYSKASNLGTRPLYPAG